MGLIQKVASKGVFYSLGILFNRIVPEWLFRYRQFVIFEMQPGSAMKDANARDNDGLSIKWCQSEPEWRSVEQLTGFARPQDSIDAKACMATYGDQTVAGFWRATENFIEEELGVAYELTQHQSWLFSAKVDHDFRNRGVYKRVLKFMTSELNSTGYTSVLLAVNPNNKPSMHVHERYAARMLGRVRAIRIFSITACFLSGNQLAKRQTISFNSKTNPVVIEITA